MNQRVAKRLRKATKDRQEYKELKKLFKGKESLIYGEPVSK